MGFSGVSLGVSIGLVQPPAPIGLLVWCVATEAEGREKAATLNRSLFS